MRASALWILIALAALSAHCEGRSSTNEVEKNPSTDATPASNAPPLQLNGTVPVMDEQNVPLDTNLLFEFSDTMQAESVTFVSEPEHPLGAPLWSKGDLLATVAPLNPFAPGATYRVNVSGMGRDGRALTGLHAVTFTTASSTSLGPSILNTFPTNGDSRAALDATLSVLFARTMDTIDVRLAVSPFVDLGLPVWSEGDRRLTFPTPLSPFRPNTRYVVNISGTDLANTTLPPDTGFVFTTVDVPDTVKPVVTGGSPTVGTNSVPTNAMVSLTFSEPMNQPSVEASFSLSPPVPCAFTWVSNTVT
ncbi:MAG: Ig-like domain-containing protein, partial [Myxococcaceae bacterium]